MQPAFLAPDVHAYVSTVIDAHSSVMRRVRDAAAREGRPAVNAQTGQTLRALVAATGGRRVLEVGTNLGYSALWMLGGMPRDGHLDTIEVDSGLAARARDAFAEQGDAERVTVHEGAALDVLPHLGGDYDFVFIDAVKSEYPAYLEIVQKRVRPRGIIAADNAFWQGRVFDPEFDDADTEGVREYTRRVTRAPFITIVLPVGDGLAVSVLVEE